MKREYILLRLAPWSLRQLAPWNVGKGGRTILNQVPWLEPWENPVIEMIKGFDVIPGKTLDSTGLPLDDPIGLPMLGSYLAAGGL